MVGCRFADGGPAWEEAPVIHSVALGGPGCRAVPGGSIKTGGRPAQLRGGDQTQERARPGLHLVLASTTPAHKTAPPHRAVDACAAEREQTTPRFESCLKRRMDTFHSDGSEVRLDPDFCFSVELDTLLRRPLATGSIEQ